MSIDYATFNAEQAVKQLNPSKHSGWFFVDRDGVPDAHNLERAQELIREYRTALVDAHAQLLEQAVTYQRQNDFNEKLRQEARARDYAETLEQRATLDRVHGNSLDALQPVLAAGRSGRKTVKVADILAILNQTKDTQE